MHRIYSYIHLNVVSTAPSIVTTKIDLLILLCISNQVGCPLKLQSLLLFSHEELLLSNHDTQPLTPTVVL
jgi:hypothetical protein